MFVLDASIAVFYLFYPKQLTIRVVITRADILRVWPAAPPSFWRVLLEKSKQHWNRLLRAIRRGLQRLKAQLEATQNGFHRKRFSSKKKQLGRIAS